MYKLKWSWWLDVTQDHRQHNHSMERTCMTSYLTLVETVPLSCTIFDL